MRDALGRDVQLPAPPQRIVSLVPSETETLFAFGLGARVVGATEYCVHPAAGLAGVPRVGGTKNPDLAAIRALAPDLVLANQEENRPDDVAALAAAGLAVYVSFPCTVAETLAHLRVLLALTAAPPAAADHVATLDA